MSLPILAVLKESEWSRSEKIGWNQLGIAAVRVDTMQEAIERLSKEQFLFIVIDADNVNYKPLLGIMSDITGTPIMMGSYHFTVADEVEALHHGADVYAPFQHHSEDNILLALAQLHSYSERGRRPKQDTPFISYDKLLVFPEQWQVFCNDEEISLTKTELDIFLYLLANRGRVLSFGQVYLAVWGNGYEDADHKALWNHAQRLKKKLARASGTQGYIENLKGVGYRLPRNGGK